MSRQYVVSPYQEFRNADGTAPLSGGSVSFCLNGTAALAPLYRDPLLTLPQENPYPLDGSGRIRGDARFDGALTLITKDHEGETIETIDDVICIPLSKALSDYDNAVRYGEGGINIVTASDGNYYVSTEENNLNLDPTNSVGYWQQVSFLPSGDDAAAARLKQISEITPDSKAMLIGDATPEWDGESQGALIAGYISGLITANSAVDATNDITITAGMCSDSTGSTVIELSSALVKQLDATWVPGTNGGGMASGASLANDTWYHIFAVIADDSSDIMFDTSVTCANGVANNAVTAFRRIGSIFRTSSAIVSYFQEGNYFYWNAKASDALASGTTDAAVLLTVSAPLGIQTRYIAYVILSTNYNGAIYFLATNPDQTDTTPGTAAYLYYEPANPSGQAMSYSTRMEIMTNTSSQIRYRFTGIAAATTNATFGIRPFGWYEVEHVRSA